MAMLPGKISVAVNGLDLSALQEVHGIPSQQAATLLGRPVIYSNLVPIGTVMMVVDPDGREAMYFGTGPAHAPVPTPAPEPLETRSIALDGVE